MSKKALLIVAGIVVVILVGLVVYVIIANNIEQQNVGRLQGRIFENSAYKYSLAINPALFSIDAKDEKNVAIRYVLTKDQEAEIKGNPEASVAANIPALSVSVYPGKTLNTYISDLKKENKDITEYTLSNCTAKTQKKTSIAGIGALLCVEVDAFSGSEYDYYFLQKDSNLYELIVGNDNGISADVQTLLSSFKFTK